MLKRPAFLIYTTSLLVSTQIAPILTPSILTHTMVSGSKFV